MNEISVTAFHYAESFCFGLLPGIVNAQNAAYNRLASEISSAFNADKPNGWEVCQELKSICNVISPNFFLMVILSS